MSASSFSLELQSGADAFGDGVHPSTKGATIALEALSHLHGIRSALDIGCGSGILALQMAYQWHTPVVASDISETSVAATRANAQHNKLAPLITAVRADGYAHDTIKAGAPYDVITCNWLAEHLHAHASDLTEHLADEGVAVLSGILGWQAAQVIEAHQQCGLVLLQKVTAGDWVTLLMQK